MGIVNIAAQPVAPYESEYLHYEFEPDHSNTLWINMAREPAGGPQKFSIPLLSALHSGLQSIKADGVSWRQNGVPHPIHYAVLRSEHPDYFNLGGDLRHFRTCIERRDRIALYQYSKLCLDIMYEWATTLNEHSTTIALIQGRALGGGFETALSADFLIAEEHSEFGFPEIMFGLFPCTGGMTLLARRIGVFEAERMMTNGRLYSAHELKSMGVIDEICPRGEGVVAVEKFISSHSRRRVARQLLQRSRYRVAPLDYQELLTVVEEWVDTAIRLTADDLRVMDALIRMQGGA